MTAKAGNLRVRDSRSCPGGGLLALAVLASISLPTSALAAEDSKSETIGPWEIEATFKGDKFDRCSINRKLDRRYRGDLRQDRRRLASSSNRRTGSSNAASIIR